MLTQTQDGWINGSFSTERLFSDIMKQMSSYTVV